MSLSLSSVEFNLERSGGVLGIGLRALFVKLHPPERKGSRGSTSMLLTIRGRWSSNADIWRAIRGKRQGDRRLFPSLALGCLSPNREDPPRRFENSQSCSVTREVMFATTTHPIHQTFYPTDQVFRSVLRHNDRLGGEASIQTVYPSSTRLDHTFSTSRWSHLSIPRSVSSPHSRGSA
jgi:hypothetical protein